MDVGRPLRREGVSVRRMEDECLLYDEWNDRLHVLNAVAGFVWELCDGSHSLRDMEEKVLEAYQVPDDVTLTDDLGRIIDGFADLDLLQHRGVEST